MFPEIVLKTALTALSIDEELQKLDKNDIEVLENYLRWSALIIECKKSALSVTADGWRLVLQGMLKVD